MGSGRMSQAWTADAATRTFLMTASWTLFFLVVASLEFVVAASQTRMSAVLYVDGVSLMLLAVAYVVELGATWPLLRHARSGGGVVASVRARTAKPVRDVESRGAQATAPASAPVTAPLRTNVAVPALVRHALGRVAVVVMTPVVLLMWASEVSEPSSNYSIDGFVISIVLVHMGALVWEFLVTPTCAVVGACRLQKAYAAGAARKLQCVSFNVTRWQGEGEAIDLGRVVAALQLDAPDVVALQDVPRALDGRQGVDALTQMAEALHMTVCFGSTNSVGTDVGHAILVSAEWEIVSHETVRLESWRHRASTAWGQAQPTAALVATLRPAGGSPAHTTPITVVSTQLGTDFGGVEQVLAMQELAQVARRYGSRGGARQASRGALVNSGVLPHRLIMCGDFATTTASPAMQTAAALGLVDTATMGRAGWLACGCGRTSAGPFPLLRRSRVLLNQDGDLKVFRTSIGDRTGGSVNQPVSVEFAVPARPARA